jgi:FdhD protein
MAEAPPYSTNGSRRCGFPGTPRSRLVAVEEPLEIRIGGEPVAVTMRTPGHDEELALGFCSRRGWPRRRALPDDLAANTVEVEATASTRAARGSFYTSSRAASAARGARGGRGRAPRVESRLTCPSRRRSLPDGCATRSGVRGDRRAARDRAVRRRGELVCVREDVGRHNAMDKVVGWAFRRRLLPLARTVLCVSGRLSFELVQKAAVAGCPILVAVGAPSSLASELAAIAA